MGQRVVLVRPWGHCAAPHLASFLLPPAWLGTLLPQLQV
jgi:hypothetical protein